MLAWSAMVCKVVCLVSAPSPASSPRDFYGATLCPTRMAHRPGRSLPSWVVGSLASSPPPACRLLQLEPGSGAVDQLAEITNPFLVVAGGDTYEGMRCCALRVQPRVVPQVFKW